MPRVGLEWNDRDPNMDVSIKVLQSSDRSGAERDRGAEDDKLAHGKLHSENAIDHDRHHIESLLLLCTLPLPSV